MSVIYCDRCGELFETDEEFLTANVEVTGRESREIIQQVVLCGRCLHEVEDHLSMDVATHEPV